VPIECDPSLATRSFVKSVQPPTCKGRELLDEDTELDDTELELTKLDELELDDMEIELEDSELELIDELEDPGFGLIDELDDGVLERIEEIDDTELELIGEFELIDSELELIDCWEELIVVREELEVTWDEDFEDATEDTVALDDVAVEEFEVPSVPLPPHPTRSDITSKYAVKYLFMIACPLIIRGRRLSHSGGLKIVQVNIPTENFIN
jgi:hypothetical protein